MRGPLLLVILLSLGMSAFGNPQAYFEPDPPYVTPRPGWILLNSSCKCEFAFDFTYQLWQCHAGETIKIYAALCTDWRDEQNLVLLCTHNCLENKACSGVEPCTLRCSSRVALGGCYLEGYHGSGVYIYVVIRTASGALIYDTCVPGYGIEEPACECSSCTYSISPTSLSHPASGGSGSVSVSTQSGCSWTAETPDADWINVPGGTRTGSGTLSYTVDANSGDFRSGTITIAGKLFTVHQQEEIPLCNGSAATADFDRVLGARPSFLGFRHREILETLAMIPQGTA